MSYIPFLKFKANEIAAVKALESFEKKNLTPFFDFARKADHNSNSLSQMIDRIYRKYELNLTDLPSFYIDNFDIDDAILIDGEDNYSYVINKFIETNFIPVVGIDRSENRNLVVFDAKEEGIISSDSIAFRFGSDDLLSYELIADEFDELAAQAGENFDDWHLIIDNRVCKDTDPIKRAEQIFNFINSMRKYYDIDKVIITGSSITPSIKDILNPNEYTDLTRNEIAIFTHALAGLSQIDDVVFGDYTAVSPNYSDVTFDGGVIRKVTTPKIIYCYEDKQFIIRGGALESHPRGSKQYNDLAGIIIAKDYYRGEDYSFGDEYLSQKASSIGKDATPSTIPKSLINAHITYMLNDFDISFY